MKTFLKRNLQLAILPLLLFIGVSGWAQPWTEDFDTQSSNAYGTGTITINSRDWTRSDAGNFSYANSNMGSYAFTINDDKAGAHITTPSLSTCGTITFKYAYKNGSSSNVFKLQKSYDNSSFTDIDTHTLGASADLSYVTYTYDVNDNAAAVYIRILSDNQNAHLFIEDFSVTAYSSSTPTITLTPTTLTGFSYVEGSGPSSEQSFTAEGSDLTADITITPPTNYEISTGTGGSFVPTDPITLSQSGGTVNSTTIYVRLKSGLTAGSYNNEDITASSSGATDKTVTCSGDVLNTEPSNHATSFAATTTSTTSSSITLTWGDNDGTQAADGFLIKASDVGYSSITAPSDGTAESDAALVKNVTHGTQTVDFTGLTASTTYYFKIWPYTNSGSDIDYKTDGSVPQATETTSAGPVLADLVFTEIADPGDNYKARFVEIYNATTSSIDLTGYSIRVYSNGSTTSNDVTLSGTIPSEGIIVIAYSQSDFNTAYGYNPNITNVHISGNGDDVYELYDGTNVVDVYGVVGVDGSGEDWEYTDSKAYRLSDDRSKSKGNPTFSTSEWNISSANIADFTPGALEGTQSQETLPIEIISFNGIRDNNQNILKWQTATEINNNYFTIERSDDAKNFYEIGNIAGAGNSNTALDYSFVDKTEFSNTVYYRLKQTDYDGKFTYSNIISVSEENQDFVVNNIYASTSNNLVINIYSNANNSTEIQVLNSLGQIVTNKTLEVSKGNGIYNIALPNLSQGIYFIKINTNEFSSCTKVKL